MAIKEDKISTEVAKALGLSLDDPLGILQFIAETVKGELKPKDFELHQELMNVFRRRGISPSDFQTGTLRILSPEQIKLFNSFPKETIDFIVAFSKQLLFLYTEALSVFLYKDLTSGMITNAELKKLMGE